MCSPLHFVHCLLLQWLALQQLHTSRWHHGVQLLHTSSRAKGGEEQGVREKEGERDGDRGGGGGGGGGVRKGHIYVHTKGTCNPTKVTVDSNIPLLYDLLD